MNPIERFYIIPNFEYGFEFVWSVYSSFTDSYPWAFTVEESRVSNTGFKSISPELTVFQYNDGVKRVLSPDNTLFFRIKLVTPKDTYYSSVIGPHSQLDRNSFLLVREIMRKEYLQQRNMSGVVVNAWLRASFGPVCDCVDPITQDVINPNCENCYGVGHRPGYHGPYTTWCTFNPVQKDKVLGGDTDTDVKQIFKTAGRLISVPELKSKDVIVDTTTDRRFEVGGLQNLIELRRVPIVQNVDLNLIPTSDPLYRIPHG